MALVLLIHEKPDKVEAFRTALIAEGHQVLVASSGNEGLRLMGNAPTFTFLSISVSDVSGLSIIPCLLSSKHETRVVAMSETPSVPDAITAIRLGALDFVETPLTKYSLVALLELIRQHDSSVMSVAGIRAHAAARWARTLPPVLRSPSDPKTLAGWAQLALVSRGTLRNWCYTLGLSPRKSLVFVRLLRAAHLCCHGARHAENLIDVVDRRTLRGMFLLAGLQRGIPGSAFEFIYSQEMIQDPDVLAEVRRIVETADTILPLR